MTISEVSLREMAKYISWAGTNWIARMKFLYPYMSNDDVFKMERYLVKIGYLKDDPRRFGATK